MKIYGKNGEMYAQKIINSKWKTPFEYQFKYLNTSISQWENINQ